jgi:hypothetical protein
MSQETITITTHNQPAIGAFRWSWPKFFMSRTKYRLSRQEIQELERVEDELRPWSLMVEKLNELRGGDALVIATASALAENPSEENLRRFLDSRWCPPFFGMQTGRGMELVANKHEELRQERVRPILARHLQKIAKMLEGELEAQRQADMDSVKRLNGAVEAVEESQACRTLRQQLEEVKRQLEAGAHDWRAVLAPFLN